MQSGSMLQTSALDRLMLKLLKKLSSTECKELVVLYELPQDMSESHEILAALKRNKQLLFTTDCLDLFIENVEAIDCQEKETFIKEANKLKEECVKFIPERQDSIPFNSQASPTEETVEELPFNVQPVEEHGPINISDLSQLVARSRSRSPEDADFRPNKRRRLDSPEVRACDSTHNSDASETEENDTQQDTSEDDEPKPATGDDLKFIKQVLEVAKKSEDPHTKVGCVVVKNGEVIGEGFNYLPKPGLPLEREAENEEDTKYPYITHAAVTAIQEAYKAKLDPSGASLYTNLFPSSRDGVFILRAKIKEVVFLEKSRQWRKRYNTGATKRLFEGDIVCRQVFIPEANTLE